MNRKQAMVSSLVNAYGGKMTEKPIDIGGPAFPLQDWDQKLQLPRSDHGMSLLDYFAGQSMIGIRSNSRGFDLSWDRVAKWSYNDAEAMLAEKRSREAAQRVEPGQLFAIRAQNSNLYVGINNLVLSWVSPEKAMLFQSVEDAEAFRTSKYSFGMATTIVVPVASYV